MEKSGPNLDGIADKYTPEALARQVLYPSEFIAHGFEQINILTTDGKVLAGRMERSNQIEVKLVVPKVKLTRSSEKKLKQSRKCRLHSCRRTFTN